MCCLGTDWNRLALFSGPGPAPQPESAFLVPRRCRDTMTVGHRGLSWPLPNVWMGVSVEDQQRADERIPLLLQTPAAIRFLSCEPCLSAIDLRKYLHDTRRVGVPEVRGDRVVHCRSGGEDLETLGDARAAVGGLRGSGASEGSTGKGGTQSFQEGRLSAGDVHGRECQKAGSGSSHSVDGVQSPRHSAGDGSQPQRRQQTEQFSKQLGDRDSQRKHDTRCSGSGQDHQATRHSRSEADKTAGSGNQKPLGPACDDAAGTSEALQRECRLDSGRDPPPHLEAHPVSGIDWLIVGGESGPGARPCDLAWIRSLRDQCAAAGVACFIKQLGARPIFGGDFALKTGPMEALGLRDSKGGNWNEWPADLRVREFPQVEPAGA